MKLEEKQKNTIYVCGGFSDTYHGSRDLYAYNTVLQTWTALAPMPVVSTLPSSSSSSLSMSLQKQAQMATRISDCMYVTDRGAWSMSMYSITTGVWSTAQSRMIHERDNQCVASIGPMVYATGGQTADDTSRVLASCEVYNSRSSVWELIAPMTTPRVHHAMASFGNKLYVFGGTSVTGRDTLSPSLFLSSCECYDPHTNQWTKIAPLHRGRVYARACVMENVIALIGGQAPVSTSRTQVCGPLRVDLYNPATDTWTLTKWRLSYPRCKVCVVYINTRLYLCGGITDKRQRSLSITNINESIDIQCVDKGWTTHSPLPLALFNSAFVST